MSASTGNTHEPQLSAVSLVAVPRGSVTLRDREHACRAGSTAARYGEVGEIAWCIDNSGDRIHEVGGKLPNAWGLHDMLGNVWEWCCDRYDPEVYGEYRVLRGGGWSDPEWSCRAGVRRRSHPTFAIEDVGFRVARSAQLPPPGLQALLGGAPGRACAPLGVGRMQAEGCQA